VVAEDVRVLFQDGWADPDDLLLPQAIALTLVICV
jgi:hypothetical protein